MVSSGLRDAGYEYINLDAGAWSPNRTESGDMQPDPAKFPSGMKSLADKLHAQKLKLGVYINLGTDHATCGRLGAYGHYVQDAKTIVRSCVYSSAPTICTAVAPITMRTCGVQAAFGADFLKVDYCSYDPAHENANAPAGGWVPTIPTQLKSWQHLRDALNATGRPIYTEFCPRSYSGSLIPPNKTTQDCNPGQRCINDGPPHEWSGETRKRLANAILTEFGNSHDSCECTIAPTYISCCCLFLCFSIPNVKCSCSNPNLFVPSCLWQTVMCLHAC